MPVIDLIDGPRDGTTETVDEPWPRSYVIVDDGAGGDASYTVNDTGTTATYVDPESPEFVDDESATGPPGPTGETGPQGVPGQDGLPGPEGPPGPPGSPFVARGEWDADTYYDTYDTVTHDGVSYYNAGLGSLNEEPPDATWGDPPQLVWGVLAAVPAGEPGPPGPTGPTGPTGPQGPPGLNNGVYSDLWVWTTKTADANTSGQIGVNQTTWAATTALNLNERTKDNRDISTLLFPRIVTGDQFYLQHKTDATRYAYYAVSGTPTDHGTWWSIPVTFTSGGGTVPGGSTDTNVSLLKLGVAANSVPVQDEGADLTTRARLNFVGAGVTATDDSTNDRTLVTIPGAGVVYQQLTEPATTTIGAIWIVQAP